MAGTPPSDHGGRNERLKCSLHLPLSRGGHYFLVLLLDNVPPHAPVQMGFSGK